MNYLYFKALHIIFIVTWFAGLFYIVRLFIYHTEALKKEEPDKTILDRQLGMMSKKLWYIITWPSAIITLVLGVLLIVSEPSWLKQPFIHIKLALVLLLYIYHFACHKIFMQLQSRIAKYTSFQLRLFNEVATIILFSIVFLIVLKINLVGFGALLVLLVFFLYY